MNIGPTFGLLHIHIRLPCISLPVILTIFFPHVSHILINEKVYLVPCCRRCDSLSFWLTHSFLQNVFAAKLHYFFCPECHSCSKQQRDATIHRNCFTRVFSRRIYGIRVTDIDRETNQ